jgi:hypothetical protein
MKKWSLFSIIAAVGVFFLITACHNTHSKEKKMEKEFKKGTFGYDVEVMKGRKSYHILHDTSGERQVLVSADLQGRVMTSSFDGVQGYSIGWVNGDFIRRGEVQEHFNPWGGEERLWIGPEGGQFSFFFKKGDPFDLDHWYTPAAFDTGPFEQYEVSRGLVRYRKEMTLENYSGTVFRMEILRDVSLLEEKDFVELMGMEVPDGLRWVGYASVNSLFNRGDESWDEQTGMPSIWLLGMFNPSDLSTIVIPFNNDPAIRERIVNDEYFGKIPPDRLKIGDGVIFFRADGKMRGKIGLGPERARDVLGSYDEDHHILTIVRYNKPAGVTEYVNSMWRIQEHPFAGDVVNAYNDGPLEGGGQLGPFYELETSSPAARLAPEEKITHISQTWHLSGDEETLNAIAQKVLGVGIGQIKAAF